MKRPVRAWLGLSVEPWSTFGSIWLCVCVCRWEAGIGEKIPCRHIGKGGREMCMQNEPWMWRRLARGMGDGQRRSDRRIDDLR